MSYNDLTTGTYPSLPDYNVKNNPNIFNFNPVSKVNQLKELLLKVQRKQWKLILKLNLV